MRVDDGVCPCHFADSIGPSPLFFGATRLTDAIFLFAVVIRGDYRLATPIALTPDLATALPSQYVACLILVVSSLKLVGTQHKHNKSLTEGDLPASFPYRLPAQIPM